MPHKESIQYHTIHDFQFQGGVKKDIKVAFSSINPNSEKGTILIPTCYQGTIPKTHDFADALPGYNVIVVAMLGNGESSSPSNDEDFPKDYSLRFQDCVSSQYALLQHLGVKPLEAIIGFSMGGQQAYYWAAMHGTFVKRIVAICSSAKTSGQNYAFLEGPVSALMASRDYDQGRYRANGVKATDGLRSFRKSYRSRLTSPEWFAKELWRELGEESLDEWLCPSKAGKASVEKTDPEDLLVTARMWQAGNVGSVVPSGDHREALQAISAKALVMPCVTDQIFSAKDAENDAAHLSKASFKPINSIWGHMAGGCKVAQDLEFMSKVIADFMAN